MSPWDAVDEAARRMAAEALERLGWTLDPASGGHVWRARTAQSSRSLMDPGHAIQAMTAAGLVEAVEARIATDREAARAANKGQHW